jgi:hypothetical protein
VFLFLLSGVAGACRPQSTTVYVPSSELGLPQPLSCKRVCPPSGLPRTKVGGGHTCLRLRGWESPNSDDRRKGLALCLLCDVDLHYSRLVSTQSKMSLLLPNTCTVTSASFNFSQLIQHTEQILLIWGF